MSIFIDPNKTFDLTIYYKYIVENGLQIGIKILNEKSEDEDKKILICKASGKDYYTMSKILEESTIINHITGKPLIRHSVFCKLIVAKFIKDWNLKNEDGVDIIFKPELVPSMSYEIVKAISKEWLRKTNGA